jgi:hypothetical protein
MLAISGPPAFAQQLTHSNREAILEKLEAIRKQADEKVDSRFRSAISAYRSAMVSGDATMDLYLKCEELVNFSEMQKKNSDFRDCGTEERGQTLRQGFP